MTEQLRMFMTPAEIMAERKVSGLEIEDEDIVGGHRRQAVRRRV